MDESNDDSFWEGRDHSVDVRAISSPQCHGEYFLEAQELQDPLPFPTTMIGMLPPEIREKIYIAALKIKAISIEDFPYYGGRYYYSPSCNWNEPPEWTKDHEDFARKLGERQWPQVNCQQSSSLALTAKFPWPTRLRYYSRLALLQTCCQVYNEAWHLYYSTNCFQFNDVSNLLLFQKKLEPKRRRVLKSISVMYSLQRSLDPGYPLAESLEFLAECPNLKELQLVVEFEDEPCFKILRKLRGLKNVNISTRLQPYHFSTSLPAWRMPSWSLRDRERMWREVDEINMLLRQPKGFEGHVS